MEPPGAAPDLDRAFDDLYARILAPALAPHEAERRGLLQQAVVVTLVVEVLGIGAGLYAGQTWHRPGFVGIGALMPAWFAWGVMWSRLKAFRTRCKAEALSRLAAAIGLDYLCDGFEGEGVPRLQGLGLLPRFQRASYEDRFAGRRQGCGFEVFEAHLEDKQSDGKSSHWVDVFRGQLVRIAFPKAFEGTTVVNRAGRHWSSPGFEPVGFASSQFEHAFQVFGTDQVEARYLVHPAFMERLLALETALGGENLRCAFDAGFLTIVVDGGDLFEIVKVLKPLPDRAAARRGVEGISHVLKLIDAVMAPPPRPYEESTA